VRASGFEETCGPDFPRVETIQARREIRRIFSRFEGGRLSFRKSAILDERGGKMEA